MEKAACQLRQTAGGAVPFAEAGIKSWLAGWLDASEEPRLSTQHLLQNPQLSKHQLLQHTT